MRRLILFVFILHSWGLGVAQDNSSKFRYGRLKNGLTYYIRHTGTQPGQADFYLVQNVGALMEEADQNGLAHVLEHMAFHATESFPEGVPAFLQRNNVPLFNANTGYDETVYNINNVSTASPELLDSCVLILRDWSGFLKLKPEDMDQERKVIREERRTRMTLSKRIQKMSDPYMYNRSKYATHDIIGSVDVVQNFTPEKLRMYYKDFYRPDQQAVMILGDIDVNRMEAEVRRLFDPIPKRENPKSRLVYRIEDHEKPLYARLIDKDIPNNSLMLVKRIQKNEENTLEKMLREMLLRDFYNEVMRGFLAEYVQSGESYILNAGVGVYNMLRDYDGLNIVLASLPGKEKEALQQLLDQVEYVHRFGFTDEILKPMFENYQKDVRANMNREDRIPNHVFLQIYKDHFLQGKPLCSVDEKLAATLGVLDTLSTKSFKAWISNWYDNDRNWVFLMEGSDSTYLFPDESEILAMISKSRSLEMEEKRSELQAIDENTALIDFDIQAGKIVKEKKIKDLDAEEWVLDNGAKVYYKYTNEDRGVFNLLAGSSGGRSVLAAEDIPSADVLSALMLQAGVYKYDPKTLNLLMKDKTVNMSLSLDERAESVSFSAASKDADFAFQLFYLLMERPRFDRVVFDRFVSITQMAQANTGRTMNDTIREALNAIRCVKSSRLWKKDSVYYSAMDYNRMIEIYQDRFQDASDFTYYLVGDVEREKARELVTCYIGAIPSIYRKEKAVEHLYNRQGNITEDVEVNMPDQKYMVSIEFQNTLKTSPKEELCMRIMRLYFQHLFQNKIRGEEGAAYGVQVLGGTTTFPHYSQELFVRFATSLDKGPEMRALVHSQVQEFLEDGLTDEAVGDFILAIKKDKKMADDAAYNTIAFWTENLQFYNKTGKQLDDPVFFEKIVDKIKAKDVLAFAQKFFESAECIDIVVKSRQ